MLERVRWETSRIGCWLRAAMTGWLSNWLSVCLSGCLAVWLAGHAIVAVWLGCLRAVSFKISLDFFENQPESALGCLRAVSFKFQLEFHEKSIRICLSGCLRAVSPKFQLEFHRKSSKVSSGLPPSSLLSISIKG